nr:hypothetical protein CFP56_02908 [Quercus suber]
MGGNFERIRRHASTPTDLQATKHSIDEGWRGKVSEESVTRLQDKVERLEKHESYDRAEIKELTQAKKSLEERLIQFLDEFVKTGARGGHDAAHLLDNHLKEYLRDVCGLKHHWQVVVRIFANFSGLTKTYCDAGVVSEPRIFREFLVAFNREFPLFEFIDAGGDKEAADNKLQENFKLYHYIEHCKHIVLATSGDSGYVSFLRPYSADTAGVSLLKSIPFPPNFRSLAENYKVIEFIDVFKVDKLKSHVRELPAANNNQSSYAAATLSSARTAPTNVSNSHQSEVFSIPMRSLQETTQGKKMWFNKHGERLDEPQNFDSERVRALLPAKLCLRYFLDTCEWTKENCMYRHEFEGKSGLSHTDRQALVRIARFRPCPSGLHCGDRSCFFGHECTYGARCMYGTDCKFGEELHNVDKEGKHLKLRRLPIVVIETNLHDALTMAKSLPFFRPSILKRGTDDSPVAPLLASTIDALRKNGSGCDYSDVDEGIRILQVIRSHSSRATCLRSSAAERQVAKQIDGWKWWESMTPKHILASGTSGHFMRFSCVSRHE